MSMKPGVTIRPRASMIRAAGPERSGSTAAIRSPVIATSADTAGAPEPSITRPVRISNGQLMLAADDSPGPAEDVSEPFPLEVVELALGLQLADGLVDSGQQLLILQPRVHPDLALVV